MSGSSPEAASIAARLAKAIEENGVDSLLTDEGQEMYRGILGDSAEIKAVQEKAGKARDTLVEDLFDTSGEVFESWFVRAFPTISKWVDVFKGVGGQFIPWLREDEPLHKFQNEVEGWTAFASLILPDFALKYATDPLYNSDAFMGIVENWPMPGTGIFGGTTMADAIYESDGDPDTIIEAIRIMHQDVSTGKVAGESLWNVLQDLLPESVLKYWK